MTERRGNARGASEEDAKKMAELHRREGLTVVCLIQDDL